MIAVCVVVVVISVLVGRGGSDEDRPATRRDPDLRAPATGATPTDLPSSSPSASASPSAPSGAAGPGGFSTDGLPPLTLPGLPGKGGNASLPKIRIHLEVFSKAPIGIVGYQVPTSLTDSAGTDEGVGTHWSLDTIAYGEPDYARLFFGAGPTGTPVTCVITVDGKVTERRSTEGPYGRTMCQG
ncbi:hypothetical protein FHP29_04120 [Nocardioides albidus]|uniref:Uncharacterized protein n=1 Tax=Nocardioides albidus TaxID=1517589 RepID=A0A5C4WFP8_9ACTN|nr:hypothetical protein [Nocardioides albidus]TNM46119.1 hypothetical protein FHP29_04120 [Nocardioides albidus]